MNDSTPDIRPLWQRRWFQVLVAVLVGLLVLSFIVPPIFMVIYELRSVLAPVLIGFGLAYVVHPLISHLNRRYGIARWASTGTIMFLGVVVVITCLLVVVPPLVAQGTELILKLKDVYPRELVELISEEPPPEPEVGVEDDLEVEPGANLEADPGVDPPGEWEAGIEGAPDPVGDHRDGIAPPGHLDIQAEDQAHELSWRQRLGDPQQRRILIESLAERARSLDWATISTAAARSLDIGVGVVGSAISFTTYILLALVIIAFCFFYFAWRFNEITGWFTSFIPASQRDTAMRLLREMDRSVNAFIRGRLIQAAVMMIILSVGWWMAGVPYWLLLGVLSGVLNLVPFLVVIGWIVALVLTVVDQATGTQGLTLWTVLGPTLVYGLAQGLDGWVVEPIVQGKATNLDPLTVLLVVMVGGTLAGLLGMLLAIPTAACIKILARELVLPRLRELAAAN